MHDSSRNANKIQPAGFQKVSHMIKSRFQPDSSRNFRLQQDSSRIPTGFRTGFEKMTVRVLCWGNLFFVGCFFEKSVKTAVPEDGNPPGALVLTKLVEWYRFGVGDENSFFLICWYCRRKELMASVRKPRENYARARSTFPKREKPARKVGGEAAHFWCPFSSFGGVELARA